jgi:hypothetical protein
MYRWPRSPAKAGRLRCRSKALAGATSSSIVEQFHEHRNYSNTIRKSIRRR